MSDSDDNQDTKTNPEPSPNLKNSKNITVAFKLNGRNYPLWSRLMKVKIGGRWAYSYIRKDPPVQGSKGYEDWEENDLVVFSWIVDNIEDDIIADFAHHQTSKALWESLSITFESKSDPYLIYDLEDKVINIKQGDLDLETYYRRIHGLWINVDRCQKQPVTCCDKGVNQFRTFSNNKRLIKFLTGLNQEYDSIRRDIMKNDPLPSVEAAYGWVKTEAARHRIMPRTSASPTVEALGGNAGDSSSGEIVVGFAAQSQRLPYRNGPPRTAATSRPGNRIDKSSLWCTHCQRSKHTYETCFKRLGYPDWWEERQKSKGTQSQAKLVVGVTGDGQPRTGNNGGQGGPVVHQGNSSGGGNGSSVKGDREFRREDGGSADRRR